MGTWHKLISSERKSSMALGPRLALRPNRPLAAPRRSSRRGESRSESTVTGRSVGEPRRGVRLRVDAALSDSL